MKCLNIVDNSSGSIKAADKVFSMFMIDGDFPPNTAVMSKDCCRHLNEINSPHEGGSNKTCNVTNNSSSKCNYKRLSVKTIFNCLCMQLIECLNAFSLDRKSTRLNSSHVSSSYAVCCVEKNRKCTIQAT